MRLTIGSKEWIAKWVIVYMNIAQKYGNRPRSDYNDHMTFDSLFELELWKDKKPWA